MGFFFFFFKWSFTYQWASLQNYLKSQFLFPFKCSKKPGPLRSAKENRSLGGKFLSWSPWLHIWGVFGLSRAWNLQCSSGRGGICTMMLLWVLCGWKPGLQTPAGGNHRWLLPGSNSPPYSWQIKAAFSSRVPVHWQGKGWLILLQTQCSWMHS